MPGSLAGSRIREIRRRAGITQSALAARCGISPSYLNLIEHNKRGIGGRVLNAIAEQLEVRPNDLSDAGHPTLLSDLREISAKYDGPMQSVADLAARFPEWAQLISGLDRRLRDQDTVISALSDRLTHDPFLSENVHEMLSNITAIRSTASLLSQVSDIPQGQTNAFHASLHSESVRLSQTAQNLADYLSQEAADESTAATSEEGVDKWLRHNAYHFEALDREAENLSSMPQEVATSRLEALISEMLADVPALSGAAGKLAKQHLHRYAREAIAMPLDLFYEAAKEFTYDPGQLAQKFKQPIHSVFRRLASLRRPWIEAPRFGLIIVSASGYPLQRQSIPGFAMPRHGNACALWPVFRAFAQPGQPFVARLAHDTGEEFFTYSYACPRESAPFGEYTDLQAAMLIVAETENPFPKRDPPEIPIGTACPICTRADCAARSVPHLFVT